MTTTSRFDYVQYDDVAASEQAAFKTQVMELEKSLCKMGDGEYHRHALKALEECYMYIGKVIRDSQIRRNGSAKLQERRVNS